MGVWSLLQYFKTYAPDAVRDVDLTDSDNVPAFDVVYVDVNSVLHGADLSRAINVVSLLRPTKAFVLAADEADAGSGGKPKPGKYLTAARYFLASAEYVRGCKHETEEVLTDQEDYVSPFVLPQAEPMPTLKRAVAEDASGCLLAAVARDVPGPADTKIASLVRYCTQKAHPSNKHCIVSRDNDMLLTALAAWSPRNSPAAAAAGVKRKRGADSFSAICTPPCVLSWPGQNWLDDGLTLVDFAKALPRLAGGSPAAALPPTMLSATGRDFTLLTLLCLGGDFCPGILGGAHYTHLHGLVERYGEVYRGAAGTRLVSENAATGLPQIHAQQLLKFLKRTGVGRETAHADVSAPTESTAAVKGWLRSLWASMAALMAGRVVGADDTSAVSAPPAAGAVVTWLEDNMEAAAALLGGGAGADKGQVETVFEIYGADKASKHLYGQGELQTKAKLPPRNPLCEVLPPYLARRVEIYKVRLAADEILPGLLANPSTAASRPSKKRLLRSPATPLQLPTSLRPTKSLFRGFGSTLNHQSGVAGTDDSGIQIGIIGGEAPKTAAPPRATPEDIKSQMWGMLGMGSFVDALSAKAATPGASGKKAKAPNATSAHDRLLLKALAEERREKRSAVKKRKREAARTSAADDDGEDAGAPKRKKAKVTQAEKAAQATAEKKAARKAKVRAVAKLKLKKKELPQKHKKKKKSQA